MAPPPPRVPVRTKRGAAGGAQTADRAAAAAACPCWAMEAASESPMCVQESWLEARDWRDRRRGGPAPSYGILTGYHV